MSNKTVSVEKDGHVLLIGMNRPEKRNALSLDMYWEVASAYGELHNDPELRCGLLFAHGDHFTAGLDLVQWQVYLPKVNFRIYRKVLLTHSAWMKTNV